MNNQHQGRLGLLRFDLDFKRFLYFLIKCNKYSKHHRVYLYIAENTANNK